MTQARKEVARRDNYEPAHPQEQFIVPLLRIRIERVLKKYLTSMSPQRVLDIGCGRQPFRAALEAAGHQYTGLDVEQNAEGTVDVVCPIDQPLPVDATQRGPFHFVLCTEVLEHVADWSGAFLSIRQLTAPKGIVLITCPHFYPLHEEPYDFWRPTLHTLHRYAELYGFRVCEHEAAGGAWDVLGTALATCQPWATSRSLQSRILTKIVVFINALVFRALKSGQLQKLVLLHSPLYLSNIVIMERLEEAPIGHSAAPQEAAEKRPLVNASGDM